MFSHRIFTLILLTFLPLLTLATPTTDLTPSSDSIIAARTFDPSTIIKTICSDDLKQYTAADKYKLQEGIDYLTNLHPPTWCDCPPHTCVRVSCSWDAGIWLCNDRDDHIYVTCPDVADYVRYIEDRCTYVVYPTFAVRGQAFDKGNWNVLVHGDKC